MKKEKKDEREESAMPSVVVASIPSVDEYNPENDQPSKLEHFPIYNKWARKQKLPVKVPTEDFYNKVKVRFQRFDQPSNVLKCRVRNKDIDWSGQLIPGCVYNLSIPVIRWLSSLAEPIYAEVKIQNDAGNGRFVEKTETRQVGERSRFSLQHMEFAA